MKELDGLPLSRREGVDGVLQPRGERSGHSGLRSVDTDLRRRHIVRFPRPFETLSPPGGAESILRRIPRDGPNPGSERTLREVRVPRAVQVQQGRLNNVVSQRVVSDDLTREVAETRQHLPK